MSNYIPHYTKKMGRLEDRERDLAKLLRRTDAGAKELVEAGEAVRDAHVRVLRARRAMFPPSERNEAALREIDEEIAACAALPAEYVLDEYRARGGAHCSTHHLLRAAREPKG